MLKRKVTDEQTNRDGQSDMKEKIEVTIQRLQELKDRVEELKRRCEEFRQKASERMEQEDIEDMPRCDRCGHAVDPNQQVAVKDSHGVERSHYHRECFQTLFK